MCHALSEDCKHNKYFPLIAKGLKQALADAFHPDLVLDVHETAEVLLVVIAGRAFSLDQQLLIKSSILQQFSDISIPRLSLRFHVRDKSSAHLPQTSETVRTIEMARSPRSIPFVDKIIAIASGKGGVGKSTVCANLAYALATQGVQVGILDADIYGPSIPALFGNAKPLAVDGSGKLLPMQSQGVQYVSFGNFTDSTAPAIWRGPMISKAFTQLCYQVEWQALDYLLIDLPPGTGDIQLTMLESLPLHGAIVVTTSQQLALLDCKKAVTMFRKLKIYIIGMVENMTHFRCQHCQQDSLLFADTETQRYAEAEQIKILAQLPYHPTLSSGKLSRHDEFMLLANHLIKHQ